MPNVKPAFWVCAALVFVVDIASKGWAFEFLRVDLGRVETMEDFHQIPPRSKPLVGRTVSLVAMLNSGMMWGAFREYSSILKVLRLAAVLVILYLLRGLAPGQKVAQAALGGILGGAIGNIYDSFVYPGVRDFLQLDFGFKPFAPFPAFNVADSAICVSVAILAIGLLRGPAADDRRDGDRPSQAAA